MDVAFGAMPMQDMAQQQAQLVAEEWGYVVVQATYRAEHPDHPTIFWEKTVTSETIQLYESPPEIQINGQDLPW
ncbi:MAG: hypothetical protein O3B01_08850 [Planctomycetota bacterium]|nr:hypothetical protein [Planctomycetota bacterium]MDA1138678.1 hypothetical protein [Planctomycetota bacterium]